MPKPPPNPTSEITLDPPGRMRYAARLISNILSPPIVGGALVVGLSLHALDGPREALKWISIALLVTGLPPLLYIRYLVRTGYLVDIHMPDRDRRIKPLIATITWFFCALLLLYAWHAPQVIILLLAATIFQMALLVAITLLWKISFHSAAIASAATVAVLLESPSAWAVISLVPLVAWARVRLNRHTPWQVILGCLAGILVSSVAFLFVAPYLF
ncbi:MAG: phosphatase PAP2 family protein, partial [Anaerolineae bacterium]